jgi:hypothetical protein
MQSLSMYSAMRCRIEAYFPASLLRAPASRRHLEISHQSRSAGLSLGWPFKVGSCAQEESLVAAATLD